MIVMVYCVGYRMYVPVFHVLLQSSTEFCYWTALHHVIIAAEWEVTVTTVTGDFEMALVNAIKDHFVHCDFPAELVLCLFHWLQAIRRKLKALLFEDAEVTMILQEIKMLTGVPENEVVAKAIPFLRSRIEGAERQDVYDVFWNDYFIPTWTERYKIHSWNVHRFTVVPALRDTLINLTNNPLERYNGQLNSSFAGPGRPSMITFVTKIRELQIAMAQTLKEIQTKARPMPVRNAPNMPIIPLEYETFQP